MEVFIGRQPIFNRYEQVFAYELLYRNGATVNKFPAIDADKATVEILINSLFSIGFEELANGKPCFINFTENLLMSNIFDHLQPNQVVIEILEDVPITEKLVYRVKQLKGQGYKIALDDFVLQDDVKFYNELFTYTDYIKVDFLLSSEIERKEIEERVKNDFPHITLLAEKVETRAQFHKAKNNGYELFQGYFFKQPQIIRGNDIPANLLQYYRVITSLGDEDPDIDDIAKQIEHDVAMSFKLLKLINSSSKRRKSKIGSIKQAILLLGLADLRKWVYILAYRESEKNERDDMYDELMKASLCRAKVCEMVARNKFKVNYSEYFLVGMFSLIDAILQQPMKGILLQLPLSDNIIETISGSETEMTPYLQLAIALDKLNWEKVGQLVNAIGISESDLYTIYQEANKWSNSIV
ncbi:HDOD domain-containing protein [Viridibacillus sp. YIM B01967]|uniref:HDOD domain-containing protein n=1 Tax=Viridibacillus soli TaxID=2798301 RepID=A0ABS1H9A2_9BACL|nr:HDOD domain-containing protein [Viridibacillus soli]MBK3495988.1 HDOD domain-containing protein [Viridibacillus soli]